MGLSAVPFPTNTRMKSTVATAVGDEVGRGKTPTAATFVTGGAETCLPSIPEPNHDAARGPNSDADPALFASASPGRTLATIDAGKERRAADPALSVLPTVAVCRPSPPARRAGPRSRCEAALSDGDDE